MRYSHVFATGGMARWFAANIFAIPPVALVAAPFTVLCVGLLNVKCVESVALVTRCQPAKLTSVSPLLPAAICTSPHTEQPTRKLCDALVLTVTTLPERDSDVMLTVCSPSVCPVVVQVSGEATLYPPAASIAETL